MPFIQAQFFVARYPQKLHSVMLSYIHQANIPVAEKTHFAKCALVQECTHGDKNSGLLAVLTVKV